MAADDETGLRVDARLTIPADELEEVFLRVGGPGGQNVNKVATAVQLRFAAVNSSVLRADVAERLLKLAGARATKAGEVLIEAARFRTQERNRADARERLRELVLRALVPPPPPRRKTRPSKGAIERRLSAKRVRGTVKKNRGRIDD